MTYAIQTHPATRCSGEFCTLHNPSDHHMADWPIVFRGMSWLDIAPPGFIERTCPHGTGHPDPDSVAHFLRVTHEGTPDGTHMYDASIEIHGCDGCCTDPNREAPMYTEASAGELIVSSVNRTDACCLARQPDERIPFFCTRPEGHDGSGHVAQGMDGRVLAAWSV